MAKTEKITINNQDYEISWSKRGWAIFLVSGGSKEPLRETDAGFGFGDGKVAHFPSETAAINAVIKME